MFGSPKPEGFNPHIEENKEELNEEPSRPDFMEDIDDDDLLMINVTGQFSEYAILNIENKLQIVITDVLGTSMQEDDVMFYFYDTRTDKGEYLINFSTQGTFEQVGEIRARLIEMIHEFGGRLADE